MAPAEGDRTPVQPSNSVLALLLADQQERWGRGERVLVESYLDKWPMFRTDEDKALDLIYHEFLLREQNGDAPTPAEYERRFPQWAEALRLLFEVHQVMPPTETPAADAGASCVLSVIKGPHRGTRLEIDQHSTVLVGRGSVAQLRLVDDVHASRHHFLLELNPPRCYLRDLGSRNGTYVNGEKVRECLLKDGDVIGAGQTHIRFGADAAHEASTVGGSARTPAPGKVVTGLALPPVPGYEILRLLGQGGMGAVYLARRQATGQQVALKVLVPDSSTGEAQLRRFLREISVLSQLDHPRIVRFHEMGLAAGQVFFAMDYVPTVPFEDLLAQQPEPVRLRTCCELVCEVLDGLAYAHARNFVHRDIKPANMLVSREGKQLQARLADFGLAKNFSSSGLSGLTHEGQALGTYAFMAPEQVLEARNATPAMDIYGVGATLYRLIANAFPHDFAGKLDPLLVVLEVPPVPIRSRCPTVPRELAAVVEQALARDPGQRFATAEAMRQALMPWTSAPADRPLL
jgi:serine/threonine-protein kinase